MSRTGSTANKPLTRRVFLRNSAGALLAGHPVFALLDAHATMQERASPLRTAAQYRTEAAQFESAFRDLASTLKMRTATDVDIAKLTDVVAGAALGIDFQHSWMVTVAAGDPAITAWVRKEIRDKATFLKFVESVKRDPRVINTIPGVTKLLTRLNQLTAEKASLMAQIISKERQMAGAEASAANAAKKAEETQHCAKVWSVVTAIVLVVVAVVVTVVSFGLSSATVEIAARDLATKFKGTGADFVRNAFAMANQRYAECVRAAALRPPKSRAKAIAACQAAWLREKVAFVG